MSAGTMTPATAGEKKSLIDRPNQTTTPTASASASASCQSRSSSSFKRRLNAGRTISTCASRLRKRLELCFVELDVGVHALDVFVLLERVEKVDDGPRLIVGWANALLRHHAELRRGHFETALHERLPDRREGARLGLDLRRLPEAHVDDAVDQRSFDERVLAQIGRLDFDEPALIEHPADAPRFAEGSVVAAEQKTQLRRGSIAIVGCDVNDHRDACRAVAFVPDLLDLAFA